MILTVNYRDRVLLNPHARIWDQGKWKEEKNRPFRRNQHRAATVYDCRPFGFHLELPKTGSQYLVEGGCNPTQARTSARR